MKVHHVRIVFWRDWFWLIWVRRRFERFLDHISRLQNIIRWDQLFMSRLLRLWGCGCFYLHSRAILRKKAGWKSVRILFRRQVVSFSSLDEVSGSGKSLPRQIQRGLRYVILWFLFRKVVPWICIESKSPPLYEKVFIFQIAKIPCRDKGRVYIVKIFLPYLGAAHIQKHSSHRRQFESDGISFSYIIHQA